MTDSDLALEARTRVEAFLEAFNNFDVDAFPLFFDNDVTGFGPSPSFSPRVDTREEVMKLFLGYPWTDQRTRLAGPPYLNIRAQDTAVQMIGTDGAVVTFHIDVPDLARPKGRRTFVLRRDEGGRWLICHVHASSYLD